MKLSNEWYDTFKFISTIFIPALCTLVGTIGVALNHTELAGTFITILSAVGVFIGSLIGLSSIHYNYNGDGNNGDY